MHGIRDVALDCVELRVVRFHLVEHRLAPASDDDLVAEFEELEGESKSDAGGASGDEDSATCEIHKLPFMSVVRGNGFGSRTLYEIMIIIQTSQKNFKSWPRESLGHCSTLSACRRTR